MKKTLVLMLTIALLGLPALAADAAPEERKRVDLTNKTFLIGDSTSAGPYDEGWFPDTWDIDAIRGSSIHSMARRIDEYLAVNRPPKNFVMAMGTNGDEDWSYERLQNCINKFPTSTNVFFVLVVRAGSFQAYKDEELKKYNAFSRKLSKERPNAWVVNWRDKVLEDPTLDPVTGVSSLLRDGTHQTGTKGVPGIGAEVYARMIKDKIRSVT